MYDIYVGWLLCISASFVFCIGRVRAMIKSNLVSAAAESPRPPEHRVPEVLALSCGIDVSVARWTVILIVWAPLCRCH